eukprot:1499095-Pyramimonas_sp.AAC.1
MTPAAQVKARITAVFTSGALDIEDRVLAGEVGDAAMEVDDGEMAFAEDVPVVSATSSAIVPASQARRPVRAASADARVLDTLSKEQLVSLVLQRSSRARRADRIFRSAKASTQQLRRFRARNKQLTKKNQRLTSEVKALKLHQGLKKGKKGGWFTTRGGFSISLRRALSGTSASAMGLCVGLDVHQTTLTRP